MATYSAQSDLLFVIHASQGEFPRVVVAPGDVEDCFYRTMEVFNISERFQIPAIILADKYLVESYRSTVHFDMDRIGIDRGDLLIVDEWMEADEYARYKITENGVSPRILPGTKGATVYSNSNEHTEYGFSSSNVGEAVAMSDKRFRKYNVLRGEIEKLKPVEAYGPEEADITLVAWGSTKGPALEAIEMLENTGVAARLVQIIYLEPFPIEALGKFLWSSGKFILIEANRTAQLGKLIKLNTGFTFKYQVLKHDGRPFNPEDILVRVREVL